MLQCNYISFKYKHDVIVGGLYRTTGIVSSEKNGINIDIRS